MDLNCSIQAILNLSLGVTILDMSRYVEVARVFVSCPAGKLVLEAIGSKPNQKLQKVSFETFRELGECVMAQSNWATIKACREELIGTPLPQWIDYIETNKARFNVMDAESVQSSLN